MKKNLLFLLMLFSLLPCTYKVHGQSDTIKIRRGDIEAARRIRRAELNDPIRPVWHLAIAEGGGKGYPFDPNGALYKDGVYHLWYIYLDENSDHWQHLSSIDLFSLALVAQ